MIMDDSLSRLSASRLIHKRFIVLVGSLVVLLIAATYFSGSGSQANADKAKLKAQKASMLSEPNPVKNPPYTFGPKCAMNVAVALDRSGSAIPYEDQLKGTLKGFYQLLHDRARSIPTGGSANVFLDAFGTYSVQQNGLPPGLTEEQTAEWFSRYDIANADNLAFQQNLVDDIYYIGDQNQPYPEGRSDLAYKGFFGGTYTDNTPFRKSRAGAGATNYDAPLTSLTRQITFWTGGDVTRRGDSDFDLVLMITDGLPNKSYGPDHEPQFEEQELVNPSPMGPLTYARQAVNTLRTGNSVINEETGKDVGDQFMRARPPVPVIGILAGLGSDREESIENMQYVFGEGNWYITSNFTDELSEALAEAIKDIGCFPNTKIVVNPDFKVTASAPSNEVEEGDDANVKLTITNTGDVAMDITKIEAFGPGTSYGDAANKRPPLDLITVPTLLPVGGSVEIPHTVIAGAGTDMHYVYNVYGVAKIDSATQECAPGGRSNPCERVRETQAKITTKAKRYPS